MAKKRNPDDDIPLSDAYDIKFATAIGKEPTWDPKKTYKQVDFIRAYNWYNYVLDDARSLAIVVDYLPEKKAELTAFEPWRIPRNVAAKVRMKRRGCPFTAAEKEDLAKELERLVNIGSQVLLQRQTQKTVASPPDYSTLLGDVENLLDRFFETKKAFDFQDWLKDRKLTPKEATAIAEYYKPLKAELEAAIRGDNKEINEAYASCKTTMLKNYLKSVDSIINSSEQYVVAQKLAKPKIIRKARKPKKINEQKLVKRLKYATANNELGLSSIDPTKVLGAKEVWLYNSKTRMLSHYVASDASGIQVKGTTLQNYNSDESEMKKIRKPEIVSSFVTDGHKAIVKDFKSLKVKPSACNGRVNEYTLILRAVK